MIAEAGGGFAHKGRIRRVKLWRGCAVPMCIWYAGYWGFRIGGKCMEVRHPVDNARHPGQMLKGEGEGG